MSDLVQPGRVRSEFSPAVPELVIEPHTIERHYWADLWRYRELFYVLAWRDLAVRYKQTAIGIAWAVMRPLLTLIVFTLIFGKLANFPSEGDAPYPIMVYSGMLPWTLFSVALAEASSSLVANANLISKVYFPRLIVPSAAVVVALADFAISFVLLVVLVLWYAFVPSWQIVFLPFFLLLALFASLGPGLWLSALNVKYRDFRYIIPFIIQLGLYISPVGFSLRVVPKGWQLLYALNPLVGVIEGFRWCIIGSQDVFWPAVFFSAILTALFLWIGIRTFRKTERRFADLI